MIIYRYRQITLGVVLAVDILVQEVLDFFRFRQITQVQATRAVLLPHGLFHDFMGLFRTTVTDTSVDAGNQETDLIFRTAAETAVPFVAFC